MRALTHEQCRREMCAGCGGSAGSNRLTPALGERLRRWAQPAWSPEVTSFPTGVCETCRRQLSFCEKEQSADLANWPGAKQRWLNFKLEEVKVPRGQLASSCVCPICQARKNNPVGKKGFNNIIKEKKQIITSNDHLEDKEEPREDKMCSKCFQTRTGPGISHVCTEASRKRNLAELVLQSPGNEQIAAKIVKEVVGTKSDENEPVRLKQLHGGNPLTISIGKKKEGKVGEVDAVVVAQLKKQLNLSYKDTKKALNILRKGNVKVEKNVMHVIDEIGSTLETHYEDVKMNFEVNVEDAEEANEKQSKKKSRKKKKEIEKREVDVTVVKDARLLVKEVMEARGLKEETLICRVVIDGGQGSLKISLSMFDSKASPGQDSPAEKLTGVNRLLILAEVDGGLEKHHNIRLLLERLQLELLPGIVLVGDLCITNVYCGISKHGGKFACYVCEGESTVESGVLRTFGSLEQHYLAYVAAGSSKKFILHLLLIVHASDPKKMQKFKNVINPCLIKAKPEELVGEKLPLPELHLLMGVVNKGHQMLGQVWPHLVLFGRGKWTVHGRYGGGLDGANSVRFLKKLGELRKVVPTHALPILDFLDIFREIQKGCFSWTLCNNYSTLIKDFVKSVKYLQTYCPSTLKISFSISWKLHMVCCHLEPLLDRLKCGLAMVCEQAGEAVHHKFGRCKARYKRNQYHAKHGKAQHKAVVQWVSWNVHPINRKTMQRYRLKAQARRAR